MADLILASASPRRRELLNNIGLQFSVIVSDADESQVKGDVPPNVYVCELALIKAVEVAKRVRDREDAIIISADTVVVLEDKILGKPADREGARAMLQSLSGVCHRVYTGYCVLRVRDAKTVCNHTMTEVKFKELTEDRIERYLDTNEYCDKAGGYGIQGKGGVLVEAITGDYQNVVGLPVSDLCEVLETEFDVNIF